MQERRIEQTISTRCASTKATALTPEMGNVTTWHFENIDLTSFERRNISDDVDTYKRFDGTTITPPFD